MEMSFSELRTKEVVNTGDGRRPGKVRDIVFCYPENRLIGIVAPGGKGFSLWKNEQFIDMKHIVRIGDDVILVDCDLPKPCSRKQGGRHCPPPSAGPGDPGGPGGPGGLGGPGGPGYPPDYLPGGRRSYEEYE